MKLRCGAGAFVIVRALVVIVAALGVVALRPLRAESPPVSQSNRSKEPSQASAGTARNAADSDPADSHQGSAVSLTPAEVAQHLQQIGNVGPNGKGASVAQTSRQALKDCGVEILPQLLLAMDTSNPVAANWFRQVYDDVVRNTRQQANAVWPLAEMKEYVSTATRSGRPRRLVLDLIEELEPGYSARWKPTRQSDPEFRHEAITLAISRANDLAESDRPEAIRILQEAFHHARDSAQVTQLASRLQALGETADPVTHLGLVSDWWLIGPFDAPGKTGFAKVFPPEQSVNLTETYQGQSDQQIGWLRHRSNDVLAQINLNEALANTREAVAYAYSEFDVPTTTEALIGCGADDNCTVWLNGKSVLAREQWLNGTRFDRFVVPVALRAGRNTLLVKVCQGPQHKDPEVPNNWSLQLRICQRDGLGLSFQSVLPPVPIEAPKP